MRMLDASSPLLDTLLSRTQFSEKVQKTVQNIIKQVKTKQDEALRELTLKYDGVKVDTFLVGQQERENLAAQCPAELAAALQQSARNILDFHKSQPNEGFSFSREGVTLGQRVTPLQSVGIYVPGGAAAYPSTVLMTAVVARAAGVERIVICTPPGKTTGEISPLVAAAAKMAGVTEIYRVGGAQAIAAMAFGTPAIPKVDKIVGPGNIYVALAKREVFGFVGIDSIAGPSEVLIIADESANPCFVAADLLSQAEHDPLAACLCITTSMAMAKEISAEVNRQISVLERKDTAQKALDAYGAVVVCDSLPQAADIANAIAPEHLELAVSQPEELLPLIKNAGAIFLGHFTPEPVGDYFAGPSHVLPTSGTARFFSPLSVTDFVKKTSLLAYTPEALEKGAEQIMLFARSEGLTAHENSVRVRLQPKQPTE